MWNLFVFANLHNTVASGDVGEGECSNSAAFLQKQDMKNAPFKLPLDHGPTRKVVIIPIPILLAEKLRDAPFSETDFGRMNGPNGIQPVKHGEEKCNRTGKIEKINS